MSPREDSVLTLEPLVEAVRDGIEAEGWDLSGLQKTTSLHFEGRWEGDSTRSAYLFFHHPGRWPEVSLDVYLDETSGGLRGNLALVLEGRSVEITGDVPCVLPSLVRLSAHVLPRGYRTPVTLRFRLEYGGDGSEEAGVEVRVKIRIPQKAVEAGPSAVSALASAAVKAFQRLLGDEDFLAYVITD